MAKKKKLDLVKIIGIVVFVLVGIGSYLYSQGYLPNQKQGAVAGEDTYIEFIDCGQGDSTLIVSENDVVLVDTTTGEDALAVVNHLKSRDIEKIDHLILTHPHEDHIGGASAVLDEFEVGKIIMKRPTQGTEPTTKIYIELLKKIKNLEIPVSDASVGLQFTCGEWDFTILGPIDDYKELNDQSVVLRGVIGDVSILLKGDQEASAEKDLVEEYGYELNSTIYAVSHHGSSGASCDELLNAVSPEYAVISCGKDNSYGHPHRETLDRLKEQHTKVFRTDLDGTVTLYTDGISVEHKENV